MLRSFDSLALRQLRTRPLRSILTAFGIVLGVAMVYGVLLLVGTIRHTFDDLITSAMGRADLVITPKAGMLPESTAKRARDTPGVAAAGAMVGAAFTRLDSRGEPVKGASGRLFVAGYDPDEMAPYDFRMVSGRSVRTGREVILERNWARDRGLSVGEALDVGTPSGPARVRVVGIFRFSSGLSFGGQGFAAMPLGEARRLGQMPSGWGQISIAVADRDQVGAVRRRLAAEMGSGVRVQTPEAFGDQIKQQLSALNVVLYFFSGVALFVGGFLILNSFNMTVLQRIREIGTLRTLGATRRMVGRTILVEALGLSVVGIVLGLGLGIGMAAGLIALMRGLDVPIGSLQVGAGPAIIAALTGVLVTTAGALWPARRAARVPPIQAVLGGAAVRQRPSLRRGVIGLVLFVPGLLLGGSLWFGNTGSNAAAFGAVALTMTMFVGMAMAAPFVIMPLVRVLGIPFKRLLPAGGRLAVDAVRSNPARTAATAAALTIGLSVVIVNSAMSASWLGTIRDQIDRNFARDFTVQAEGWTLEQGGGPGVPKTLERRIAAMPEVGAVSPVRSLMMELPGTSSSQQGLAIAYDPTTYGELDTTPVKGVSRARALRDVSRGGILAGPQYAKAAHLKAGDHVTLNGAEGRRRARVAGVLQEIGEFAGYTMQMSIGTMHAVYGVTTDAQLAVKARSDAGRAVLERRLDGLTRREYPNLELQSAADKKDEVDAQISRQFNFFNAIVAIAVIVSVLGVVNTLAMSVLERTRELGVLRALGASRWQVRRTMLDESLLITVAGALAGLALGALIAFFWVASLDNLLPGMSFRFPTGTAVMVAIASVVLGTLAAILPARRAARLKVIEALQYE
jgi:putative ABC transport system permease protein